MMNMMTPAERIAANVNAKGLAVDPAKVGVDSRVASVEPSIGDKRCIWVTANTDDIDLDGEVVVPSGANTSYFFSNKAIFLDHYTDHDHRIGTLRKVLPFPNHANHKAWRVLVYVKDGPVGDDILKLAADKAIGSSVGFFIRDESKPSPDEVGKYDPEGKGLSRVIRAWDWLELSLTSFPANVRCQTIGIASDGDKMMARIDEMATKGRINRQTAVLLGLKEAKKKIRIVCQLPHATGG